MKITFIVPDLNYVEEYMPDYSGHFSHGVGYLSAALKQAGHATSLIHITKPISQDFLNSRILEERPDIIGFSLFSHQWPYVKELASWAKQCIDVPIVAGGVHPTIAPDDTLRDPNIDIVCRGEGEEVIVEFCEHMENGGDISNIRNLWIKNGVELIKNDLRPLLADLDERPFPDRSIFDFEKLTDWKIGALHVLAGRGCPYDCSYCCNHQYKRMYGDLKNYVRFRKPESVIEEIKKVRSSYPGLDFVNFLDDTFCLNKNWLGKFLPLYRKEIGMRFHGNSRVNVLTEDVIRMLSEAGCQHLTIGIESGNEHIRRDILKREMTNDAIIQAFEFANRYGIRMSSYNMVGIPDETLENTLETTKLNARAKSYAAHVSIFQPYPHTELYKECLSHNYIKDNNVSTFFGRSILRLPTLSPDEITFAYKYFLIFKKLYAFVFHNMPRSFRGLSEKALDNIYLNSNPRVALAFHPLVQSIVSPKVFIKRQMLRCAPNLSRWLKQKITKKKYM